MQIKKAMRQHYTPIRRAKFLNTDTTKCWQECGAARTLIHRWRECQLVQTLLKTVRQFLANSNMLLPYDPGTVPLSIYAKDMKPYVHTKVCTWMFTAVLFIMATVQKRLRRPSVGEWVNKLIIQIMQYYSMLKKWAIKPWKDVEETYMHITKWKKPIWKGYVLYIPNNDTVEKGKIEQTVKNQWLPEEWRQMNMHTVEDF